MAVLGRKYRPRLIDAAVENALNSAGAVVIEGARACGKTMSALNAAQSYVFLDDPNAQRMMVTAPHALLSGEAPRLLDEWQVAPDLWNMVRRAVDAATERGQFILTGSAVPADDITRHTGAGRFIRLRQRTMTWPEKTNLPPTARVSLSALFDGQLPQTDLREDLNLDAVIANLLCPGFPEMTDLSPARSADRLRGYIDDTARADIHRIADIRHEPEVIKQLVTALARNVAAEPTFTTLSADVRVVAPSINPETIATYVELLQRLFVIEAQRPWTPALRSRATVRTSSKYHLVDPALAAAALGAGPEQLHGDVETTGLLFESAVVHDLMVYASLLRGEVRHYRDSNKREIDAIITLPGGRWAAVEIKLGAARIPEAMMSLNKAVSDIDTASVGEPAFRLVVTGTGPTYVADDGTITAPLHALAP